MISTFFIPLLAAASVAAHGFVSTVTIDGKVFKGTLGKTDKPADSVIRQVTDPNPTKGAQNPAVNCGPNAQASSLIADAQPGSQFTFDWTAGNLAPWPHNTGPMLTYMASCGATTCDKFDSSKAQWFKIQQVGRKANGEWAQADLMNGAKAEVTLPSNIAPGNYLIRHEIIALHLATAPGGAEFYASCTQLKVGGNQKGVPAASELVSLPGAYSDTDPGILDPDVFNAQVPYNFPGPKIASFISGDSSAPAPSGSPAVSGSSASAPLPSANAPSPSATGKKGSCHKKTKSSSAQASSTAVANAKDASAYRPRRHSRIMRNLASKQIH
ncbi:glycoside hydrolase family 61 protein [Infundibulicybe gibba]|nr:glycoside hydrolase family 61 protein [Infundibulicybe gibba]